MPRQLADIRKKERGIEKEGSKGDSNPKWHLKSPNEYWKLQRVEKRTNTGRHGGEPSIENGGS